MSAALLQLRTELESRFDIPQGIRSRADRTRMPTGIEAIDQLTSGGIERGTLTEICGADSSGRTALAISILSRATCQGECCAWIDAAGAFDPASAVEMGADLDRLLWVNCGGSAENALKCCDLLIQAGGFGLVVFDLADTPEPEARRIPLASWFRLRHAAERVGAALVAMTKRINAQSCSTLQMEMRRKRTITAGHLLKCVAIEAESRKHFRSRTADFTLVR
jgi:RecA/RadA recombinase